MKFLISLVALGSLSLSFAANIVDDVDTANHVDTESQADIKTQADIKLEDDLAFATFFQVERLYENLASYKLMPSEGCDDKLHCVDSAEQIEVLQQTSEVAFHDSLFSSPILRHERPGYLMFQDVLNSTCAEFRAKRSSIESSAFSREEKIAFVVVLSGLGVFRSIDIEAVKAVKLAAKQAKSSVTSDELLITEMNVRAMLSGSLVISHFCRDALRIVAGVLNSEQIEWLLKRAPSVVLFSPEFMDQLEDFSMFTGSNVVEAFTVGHYDWFKNEKALRTLPASALLDLFANLRYDLTEKQLEALNAARPVVELFNEPEFQNDAFAWQITAGTPYFCYINIERLIEEIEKGTTSSSCSEDLHQALFAFYVHSEYSINFHINGLLIAPFLVKPEGMDFVEVVPHEEVIKSICGHHMNALEYLMLDRQKILKALITKFSDLETTDLPTKNLLGLLVKSSVFAFREAMTILEQVKSELMIAEGDNDHSDTKDNVMIEDLIEGLRKCRNEQSSVYYRPTALILAYLELNSGVLLRIPYRHIPGTKAASTLNMVQTLRALFLDEKILFTKWPRVFLVQQARDFMMSKEKQQHEIEKKTDSETLAVIFDQMFTLCDMGGFDDALVKELESAFAEESVKLLEKYSEYQSIEALYVDFRSEAMSVYTRLTQQDYTVQESILDLTVPLNTCENELLAIVQNDFKPEMARFMIEDAEFMGAFGEFAHVLKRSQVAGLLACEEGRALLASNRKLLYNLPTYEDFKVTDLKALKFQAQYACMLRTVPLLVTLISFKADEYTFNDPLGVAWRLFGCEDRIKEASLLQNAWRIAPAQFFAEFWNSVECSPEQKELFCAAPVISGYLSSARDLQGKALETIRATLHWIILQELKFVEAFALLSSDLGMSADDSNGKRTRAFNSALFAHSFEVRERVELAQFWILNLSMNPQVKSSLPSPRFLPDLLEILKGPISQVRGGCLLAAVGLMDKNLRSIRFNRLFAGFDEWKEAMVKAFKAQSAKDSKESKESESAKGTTDASAATATDVSTTNTDTTATDATATTVIKDGVKYIFKTVESASEGESEGASEKELHTNIPQYREIIEKDVQNRQFLLRRMLNDIDVALKIEVKDTIWKNRLRLLGMISADGFTPSRSFNNAVPFTRLPVHELVLHRKLEHLTGLVGRENIPEGLKPEQLALVILQFASDEENKPLIEAVMVEKEKTEKEKKREVKKNAKKNNNKKK